VAEEVNGRKKRNMEWQVYLIIFLAAAYLLKVFLRIKEIVGNYRDEETKSKRDEKLKLEEVAQNMAERGLASSGMRKKAEDKVKQDFEFERRKRRRKLWRELVEALLLLDLIRKLS